MDHSPTTAPDTGSAGEKGGKKNPTDTSAFPASLVTSVQAFTHDSKATKKLIQGFCPYCVHNPIRTWNRLMEFACQVPECQRS